jgi:hypothetical protein
VIRQLVTAKVVESAPTAGIMLGWSVSARLSISGNVVRKAEIATAVSVVAGAGTARITDNLIAETRRGAIVGMVRSKAVTWPGGAEQYAHLARQSAATGPR